jgi:amino acid adenylation domain-containing protein
MLEEVFHFPLSYAQQRLWFIDQLDPAAPTYNISSALRLSGELNVAALSGSIDEIIRRHEVLRTTFSSVDGQPVQIISLPRTQTLSMVDLSDLDSKESQAIRLAKADAQRGFDLERGPLLRATLLRLAPTEHIGLFALHHIISDGWSMGILIRELSLLYDSFCHARPSPLKPLALQYADFAVWQREWLTTEKIQRQLQYWRKQLAPPLPVLELPSDRPRSSVSSHGGATRSLRFSEALTESLNALSKQHEGTLFMTLMSAFNLLLCRYTGEEDIIVGTPVTNRNRAEVEDLIGLFVNTLVIRTDLSGVPKFAELLSRVKRVILEAQTNQHLPFEKLVDELQPDRDFGHTPLFQVMFVHEPARREELGLHDLKISTVETDPETAKFDVSLFMGESDRHLTATLRYNTDLFNADLIERMLRHLKILLEGIVDHPDRRSKELPLLTEEESRQLLVTWNGARNDRRMNACLHDLFESQVERTPDAVAIVFEDQWLTYTELNRRANQLARHLRRTGVGVESAVAIYLERSAETITAMLGVLKAGGCYLPIDTATPKPRLSFMLEEARTSIVITRQELTGNLPEDVAWIVAIDSDWHDIDQYDGENLVVTSISDNAAYIIFTSGSTGKPKGAIIAHTQIVNYLGGIKDRFEIEPGLSFALAQSLATDASKTLTFYSLCFGGHLHLIDRERAIDPQPLGEYFSRHSIDCFKLAPSHLSALLEQPHPERIMPRRWLILGGEVLPFNLARSLDPLSRGCSIINQYGPTEATIGVLVHDLSAGDDCPPSQGVPLGRPLQNVEVYLLDRHTQLVPAGAPGELHIGGDCLARGYSNNPAMTAEKFIPNPFGSKSGARLYKTGDRIRYLPDGKAEFIGRIDDQIKVRGFRVEPREIEVNLLKHPALQSAAVIVREDGSGGKRLVAYVVTAQAQAVQQNEVREFLWNLLPDYMIPSRFVMLDSLPLTPHGKLDRRALPGPDETEDDADQKYLAPRTIVEQLLAGIWADVLHVENVGLNDNFFELGGHSLLATQVISRVQKALQTEIPLKSIFEAHNLLELAKRIEEERAQELTGLLAPIESVSEKSRLLLSYAQQRLWFIDQFNPFSSAYNLSSALRLSGQLNISALSDSISEIIRRHEILRTTFSSVDGQPVQIISDYDTHSLSVVDLSGLDSEEAQASRLAEAEAERGFDLEAGPLLRATLLKLATTEHIILFTLHHIISDGWSIGILIRELCALYHAFCDARPSPLKPLALQYTDFAVWQRKWLTTERLQDQLEYWRRQLAEPLPVLELPTDRPRPAIHTMRGARQSFALPASLLESLAKLSRKENATLFMTLMAAFKLLLHRYSHQEEIIVGTVIANRNHLETEDLIGFFVNMGVMRTNLAGDPSFQELLGRIREVAIGAYTHQDVPFERLVEEFQSKRDLSRHPLFQVVFVLQNMPQSTLQLPGLTFSSMEVKNETAKFDLTFILEESRDGLLGTMEYNTDIFDESRIGRMLDHFRNLLEAILRERPQSVSTLSLLSEAECNQLLIEWNDTASDYPQSLDIGELSETQAKLIPEAIAVAYRDEQLTYQELNRRVNRLALFLQRLGVGPEVLVGLCLERSVEMVVAVLGVLKAGGAFLPLDPAYPVERLGYMLTDASVKIVLTKQELKNRLGAYRGETICLDWEWERINAENGWELQSKAGAENLAYVIYTSGSTGKPKGVMVTYRGLTNYLWWAQKIYLPENGSVVSSSLSFDATITSLMTPLLCGGTVLLLPEQLEIDGLKEQVQAAAGCGLIKITPSHLEVLGQSLLAGKAGSSVGVFVIGGEAISPSTVRLWRQIQPGVRMVNEYGPTETVVGCVVYEIPTDDELTGSVPIGRPIANTRIYLLDRYLRPVPVGVTGEIYIGGAGVARGYLNRPELTAERFTANPFADEPMGRMYKTGDLGRYLADGTIEYLGRNDFQVKVRGFRIELSEIEAALVTHPEVGEAVVLAREEGEEGKRLVAYYSGEEVGAEALRTHLSSALPKYMIPEAFVHLESMPLTLNGKLDRRALPPPEDRAYVRRGYEPPTSEVEIRLARIWTEVLKLERVGRHDNFFELGGHSLLAMRLVSKLKQMEIVVPVNDLFMHPTVESLATHVQTLASNSRQKQTAIQLRTGGADPPLFLVHDVTGEIISGSRLTPHLAPHFSVYGLPSPGFLEKPLCTIEAMAARLVRMVRDVQPEGPYRIAGWSFGAMLAYEIASQLIREGASVEFLGSFDGHYLGHGIDRPENMQLDDQSLLLALKERSIAPADLSVDEVRQYLEHFRNNLLAAKNYAAYSIPILLHLFVARDSEVLAAASPHRNWETVLPVEQIRLLPVPGTHLSMMESPQIEALGDAISQTLRQVRATRPPESKEDLGAGRNHLSQKKVY